MHRPSGLFFQKADTDREEDRSHHSKRITYIDLGDVVSPFQDNILFDFLPEPVVLMASSNGLLCCRGCVRSSTHYFSQPVVSKRPRISDFTKALAVIYVCNPTSKEWFAIEPTRCNVGDYFGLAFYPFGSSAENTSPCFKVVALRNTGELPRSYYFSVYSSETRRWKASNRFCYCDYHIYKHTVVSVGHRFHWLTTNHHIITFDMEQELPAVIKLPGPVMEREDLTGVLLGSSEGYLHYVRVRCSEVRVWVLKDYCKPEWVLKHNLNLVEFCGEHGDFFS